MYKIKFKKGLFILGAYGTLALTGCNNSHTADVEGMTIKEARELAEAEKNNNENIDEEIKTEVDDIETNEKEETTEEVISENEQIDATQPNLNSILSSENIDDAKDIATEKFILITDYIFYGTEIDGKKFKDQTEETKIAILNNYEMLDNKMEQKFPNYKENLDEKYQITKSIISEKTNEIGSKAKEKIIEKVGQEKYDEYGDTYNEIKDEVKTSIDAGMEITGEVAGKAKTKIKSWYEEFKEKQ